MILKQLLLVGLALVASGGTALGTDYLACRHSIQPALTQIRERVQTLQHQIPETGKGPQVPVGSCASRLRKLAGNFLCCHTFSNTAAIWEEISCLELKKFYLEKTCECSARNSSYSNDEVLQDQSLELYAAAKKLRDNARKVAIPNSIITEYLRRIDQSMDCINQQTISIVKDAMKELEKALSVAQ